ncbi:MAG: hypothetical protein KU37_06000 [Sulfuricurvum sp. PC08-66]|nr:MAG: hypothetical protein KU37_06000 [Sulfuricurvum sp. PC08-66]
MLTSQQLCDFLDASVTPFHAAQTMQSYFVSRGFEVLDEAQAWELKAGEGYVVVRNGSALIAFVMPHDTAQGWRILGAHTDSPALRLKPKPQSTKAGMVVWSAEVYGGVLLNPWFDRALGVAGRVSTLDAHGEVSHTLVRSESAVGIIPSLAIHLDPNANTNRTINAQKELSAVVGIEGSIEWERYVATLAQLPQGAQLLGHELYFYDTQKASTLGVEKSLITSARLDNLLSCFMGMHALVDARQEATMVVFNDHEEVGSDTFAGANGNFLTSVWERIVGDASMRSRAASQSLFVSTDNAHALHPNYIDVHEANHAPLLGRGMVLKHNANQNYSTNATSEAYLRQAALAANVPLQSYVVRSDMRCGSTIGPMTSARMGMASVDIGVPTWSMHSIRETAHFGDILAGYSLLRALLERTWKK